MNVDSEMCKKCGKLISNLSILLHESTCSGEMEIITQMNKIPQEEFYHCESCDMYFNMSEKGDHMLSHQYADEYRRNGRDNSNYEEDNGSERPNNNLNNRIRVNTNTNNMNNLNTDSMNNMDRFGSNSSQVISNSITEVNGVRTITQTIRHPNGSITTTTRTVNTNNNNNMNNNNMYSNPFNNNMNSHPIHRSRRRFPYNEFGSYIGDEDDNPELQNVDPFNPFNNIRMRMPRFPHGGIMINNGRDFEAFLQQLMSRGHDNPVDDDILSALPEITVEDVNKLPNEKRDCVVCLCKYEPNEKALILPCTHIFHTQCIRDWLKTQNTCPICKSKIDRNSLSAN